VPGSEAIFNFQITAPAAAGTYNLQWRMVEELVTWFGDFTPNMPIVVQAPLKRMSVSVRPYPVPAGHPVSITVSASDAVTGSAIIGANVLFNGAHVGTTGTPFITTIPIRRFFDPDTRRWITEPVPPNGMVTMAGYAPAMIDFG
jgi:hypothetical protein